MKILFAIFFWVFMTVGYSQNSKMPVKDDSLKFTNLFDTKLKPSVSCYRIPAMVTAPNGDLIVAIDERVPSCGDLKWNNDINIVGRRSTDNGKSWSNIETIADYPIGKSASDPSMIVDKITGTIFLFFNYMDLDNEKDIYYLMVTKSFDNGKTWSPPIDITPQISKPYWHKDFKFITSGRGIQTNSGKLLHTLVNLDKGLYLFGSDNHGENWHLIDNSIIPGDESKVVQLIDDTWMVNSRVNNKGLRFVHTSADQGTTWFSKPDSTLIDPGCNASIIRYTSVKDGANKNRLLFSNAKMESERTNLTLRISYDEGKTWTKGKTIYTQGSAYSSLSILSNGNIGLFFEKDGYKENVFTQFSLEWLTDGNDKLTITPKK
ncbi:sialidase family protein [Flagellimonas pacifica]|uniref:exo-alpha-sialidase n=1 Tax=Flagellimonas pacifica TaxID=1247520 RepID=A0A285MVC8_9FLAO|nr:sialidase family protein [Allomuricauda parva]SNZ01150.1 sialidase-1 [Allomuricauda parva]